MLSGESFLPLLPGFLTFWVLGWDSLTRTGTELGDLVLQVPSCYSLDPVFFKGPHGYGLLPREVFVGGGGNLRR